MPESLRAHKTHGHVCACTRMLAHVYVHACGYRCMPRAHVGACRRRCLAMCPSAAHARMSMRACLPAGQLPIGWMGFAPEMSAGRRTARYSMTLEISTCGWPPPRTESGTGDGGGIDVIDRASSSMALMSLHSHTHAYLPMRAHMRKYAITCPWVYGISACEKRF